MPVSIEFSKASENTAIAYVVDCSINDDNLLVYEIQPVQASLLSSREWYSDPRTDISGALTYSGIESKFGIHLIDKYKEEVIIPPTKKESPWFCTAGKNQIQQEYLNKYQYRCIYTQTERNAFLNKAYQALILQQHCPELLPETKIYSRELDLIEVASDISQHFKDREIVFKATLTAIGCGNYFGLNGSSS